MDRIIDAHELIIEAKKIQGKLYAESYDEILSFDDLVKLAERLSRPKAVNTDNTLEAIADAFGLTPEGISFALSQYSKVICELTCGRMSKLTYDAAQIISVINDCYCDGCEYREESEK